MDMFKEEEAKKEMLMETWERFFSRRKYGLGENEYRDPLHIAAMKGNHDIVKILIENGADVNSKDVFGPYSPLTYAVMGGIIANESESDKYIKTILKLLEAGAKVEDANVPGIEKRNGEERNIIIFSRDVPDRQGEDHREYIYGILSHYGKEQNPVLLPIPESPRGAPHGGSTRKKATRRLHNHTKKFKKHTKKRKTKKYINRSNDKKLTIDINFSSKDGGFSVLQSKKMMNFFLKNIKKGRNVIQTVPNKPFYVDKKTTLHLQAIKYDDYAMRPEWSEILCESHGKWLKSNPCKIGTSDKVFVKYRGVKNGSDTRNLNKSGGLSSYLYAILKGEVDEKKHLKFVQLLRKTMKKSPVVIHNMDVDWFHLKSETN